MQTLANRVDSPNFIVEANRVNRVLSLSSDLDYLFEDGTTFLFEDGTQFEFED